MADFLALVALLLSECGGVVPWRKAVSSEVVFAVASAVQVSKCMVDN